VRCQAMTGVGLNNDQRVLPPCPEAGESGPAQAIRRTQAGSPPARGGAPGGRPLGSAMRYPPHREIESRHPPAPRRGALAIHLVHVYRAQEPCAPSIIRPLLNRKLYAVPGVFQCRESCRTVRVDGKAAAWYGWRGEGRSDVVVKRSTEQHNEAHIACDEQGCRTPYLDAC
jgi:hypothetical protein